MKKEGKLPRNRLAPRYINIANDPIQRTRWGRSTTKPKRKEKERKEEKMPTPADRRKR
jgi:hypothetical protein